MYEQHAMESASAHETAMRRISRRSSEIPTLPELRLRLQIELDHCGSAGPVRSENRKGKHTRIQQHILSGYRMILDTEYITKKIQYSSDK